MPLGNGLRIQVLPCVDDLPKARKNQCAAFLAAESLLVVWDDDPTKVVERATAIEDELMNLVWMAGEAADAEPNPETEKPSPVVETELDMETGETIPEKRPTNVINSVMVAFTIVLIMTMLAFGYKQIAFQLLVDKGWWRLAFLVMTPVLIFFSLVSVYECVPPVLADADVVLLPGDRHQLGAMLWSYSPDAVQLEVLFRTTSTTHQWPTSSHHRAMPGIQGGFINGHFTYGALSQASHLHL